MSGGLKFSGFESDYVKNKNSTFRKAGDAFTEGSGNTMNNSSVGNSSGSNNQSAYATWMKNMGNMNSSSNSPNNSSTPAGWTPKSSTNSNASNPDYINTKDPNQTPASQPAPAPSKPVQKQFNFQKAQDTMNNYTGAKTAKELAAQIPNDSGMPSPAEQQQYAEFGKYAQAEKLLENPWKEFNDRLGKDRMPNEAEIAEMVALMKYQKKNPPKQQPAGIGRVGAFASPFY